MSGGKVDIFMPIYIGDYMKDTSFLTTEQHGAYLLMLFACWQHGSIPNDDGVICSITKMSPGAWDVAKSMILRYFVVNGDNLEHNRISKELDKAKKNKAKAVDRAKKGADARWNKKTDAPSNATSNATSTPQAMLDQCPSPSPSPSPTKSIKDISLLPAEAVEVADSIISHVIGGNPKAKNVTKDYDKTRFNWSDAIDKMNRLDGRTWCEINSMWRWIERDVFWSTNILSGTKFRDKYDELFVKMKPSQPTTTIEIF